MTRSREGERIAKLVGVELIHTPSYSEADLKESLRGVRPDVVYNLAAAGVNQDVTDPMALLAGNVEVVVNLLRVLGSSAMKFIHAASCFEYAIHPAGQGIPETWPLDPHSQYGAAKIAASHCGRLLAEQLKVPFMTLRLFGCYGPGESSMRLLPYLVRKLTANESIDLTPGDQVRDLLYIDDMAEGLLKAAAIPIDSVNVFNICSGHGSTVREVVSKVCNIMGKPESLLQWGARPARAGEPKWIVGDPTRFAMATGWSATTNLHDGLGRTIEDLIQT